MFRYDMVRSMCVVQIQPTEHVLNSAHCTTPTRKHVIYVMQIVHVVVAAVVVVVVVLALTRILKSVVT